MSAPRTDHAEILAAYLAGMPRDAICERFKCGKKLPATIAKQRGVLHLRPRLNPVVLRQRVMPARKQALSNRIAVSDAHRIIAPITLPALRWLQSNEASQ